MGLALCHTLPRDTLMRVAALLAVVACLLQVIALADGGNRARMRWLTVENRGATFAATPWEVIPEDDRGRKYRGKICPAPLGTTYVAACDEYLREMSTVAALSGISVGLTIIMAVLVGCCVAKVSAKNTRYLLAYAACHIVPTGFACAALGVLSDRVTDELKNVFNVADAFDADRKVRFSYGGGILATAVALHSIATIVALIKVLWFYIDWRRLKAEIHAEGKQRARRTVGGAEPLGNSHGNGDATRDDAAAAHSAARVATTRVGGDPVTINIPAEQLVEDATFTHDLRLTDRVAVRVVNDDWERQKAIWLERRAAVQRSLVAAGLGTREARMRFTHARMGHDVSSLSGTVNRVDISNSPVSFGAVVPPRAARQAEPADSANASGEPAASAETRPPTTATTNPGHAGKNSFDAAPARDGASPPSAEATTEFRPDGGDASPTAAAAPQQRHVDPNNS